MAIAAAVSEWGREWFTGHFDLPLVSPPLDIILFIFPDKVCDFLGRNQTQICYNHSRPKPLLLLWVVPWYRMESKAHAAYTFAAMGVLVIVFAAKQMPNHHYCFLSCDVRPWHKSSMWTLWWMGSTNGVLFMFGVGCVQLEEIADIVQHFVLRVDSFDVRGGGGGVCTGNMRGGERLGGLGL